VPTTAERFVKPGADIIISRPRNCPIANKQSFVETIRDLTEQENFRNMSVEIVKLNPNKPSVIFKFAVRKPKIGNRKINDKFLPKE
jgi:hypothetical protein